jgi:hypothetical protein
MRRAAHPDHVGVAASLGAVLRASHCHVVYVRQATRATSVRSEGVSSANCPRQTTKRLRASRARCAIYGNETSRNTHASQNAQYSIQDSLLGRELSAQYRGNDKPEHYEHFKSEAALDVVANRHLIPLAESGYLLIETYATVWEGVRTASVRLPLHRGHFVTQLIAMGITTKGIPSIINQKRSSPCSMYGPRANAVMSPTTIDSKMMIRMITP